MINTTAIVKNRTVAMPHSHDSQKHGWLFIGEYNYQFWGSVQYGNVGETFCAYPHLPTMERWRSHHQGEEFYLFRVCAASNL